MSAWTHAACDECYSVWEEGAEPVRIVKEDRVEEECCFCGDKTKSGIYYRADPAKTLCGGKCDN